MQITLKEVEFRLDKLRSIAEGLRSISSESVTGGIRRDLADIETEIDSLKSEYETNLILYSSEIAEGYKLCPTNDLPRYVCWLHWAEHLTWSKISEKIGYSADHIRKILCVQGVESLYEEMPNRWRASSPKAN